MSTHNDTTEPLEIDTEHVIAAIKALQPGKMTKKTLLFQQYYPVIVEALARKVLMKSILELLKDKGLPLSVGGFNSLMKAEQKRREDCNDVVKCQHCGSPLTHSQEV